MAESRNAANDPADYFEYIMLAWGNCQAGDRLVMERKLVKHPDCTFDGVLPMKINDEIVLKDWLNAMVIPAGVELDVPECLKDRTIYIENDCQDIWDWSEKVYRLIERGTYEYYSSEIRGIRCR